MTIQFTKKDTKNQHFTKQNTPVKKKEESLKWQKTEYPDKPIQRSTALQGENDAECIRILTKHHLHIREFQA
jgi:hypothetical protein